MYEIMFSGYGYLRVEAETEDEAKSKVNDVLDRAGIDFTITDSELRDENGNPV